MLSDGIEYSPQIDETLTIEMQRFDRRSTRRRQTKDDGVILVPGEMLGPDLMSWMKQQGARFGQRINGGGAPGFVLITSETSESQIVGIVRSADTARDDVIDRQRIAGISPLYSAVLAKIGCTFGHAAAHVGGKVVLSHAKESQRRVESSASAD